MNKIECLSPTAKGNSQGVSMDKTLKGNSRLISIKQYNVPESNENGSILAPSLKLEQNKKEEAKKESVDPYTLAKQNVKEVIVEFDKLLSNINSL